MVIKLKRVGSIIDEDVLTEFIEFGISVF